MTTGGSLSKLALVAAIALCLLGCSSNPTLRHFQATSSESAIDELSSRRRALNNFKATTTIRLRSSRGDLDMTCDIFVEHGDYWRIKLDGPMGVDLALIEISKDRFKFRDLQHGERVQGFLDDPLLLPGVGEELPKLKLLRSLLLPTPDLPYPQDWTILKADPENKGELRLSSNVPSEVKQMKLILDYSPLRVHQEVGFSDAGERYSRNFTYDNQDEILPQDIDVTVGAILLQIHFKSFKLQKPAARSSGSIPL